jgi:inosose dehydratase
MSDEATLAKLKLGTAPDSWGIWFPDDPQQVPWTQFLDEAQAAGYRWIELGPYGYLPTEPAVLADELGRRDMLLTGGAVFVALHRGADGYERALADCNQEAQLLTALGARHMVILPESFSDLDGAITQPKMLSDAQWDDLCSGMNRLGRHLRESWDLSLVFHSHADSHVGTEEEIERFLADTDPELVNLCLDTGHVAYYGGDALNLIRRHPDRIGYVHLKQVDPEIRRRVHAEGLGFAPAVRLGVMCEPPAGDPEMAPVVTALEQLDREIYCIVEQDMYPCAPDKPFPIAERTRRHFSSLGLNTGSLS